MLDIADLLTKMKNRKVHVSVEDGKLRIDSVKPLNNNQRTYLKRYKQKIIEHLIVDRLEAAEERAAIMEYDGGLSRQEAEKYAVQKHLKPFDYECLDGAGTLLTPYCDTLEEAREALEFRFGQKLISVTEKR